MISLQSHSTAIEILETVLGVSVQSEENTLLFTTVGVSVADDGKETKGEWFFFNIGSDLYSVRLYEDGGEVQRLGVIEAWTAFPSDDNEEEEEVTDVEED